MSRFYFMLFTLFLSVISIQAAEKKVELTASSTEVFESDVFDLNIVLNNFEASDLSLQKISFGDKLKVVQGPFQSQQTSIVNGKISSSLTLIYRVTAAGSGVIIVPPIVIAEGGKKYSSNELKISVFDNNSKMQKSASTGKSAGIFVRTIVSKNNPYLGEPVLLEKVLYVDPDLKIRKPELADDGVLKGFLKEDKDLGTKGRTLVSRIFEGRKYNTVTIQEMILIPTRSGELEIPSSIVTVPVLEKSRRRSSVFDDPFFNDDLFSSFSNFNEKSFKSPSQLLTVRELPEEGKPAGFSGLVGSYELHSSISTQELKVDNPLTLNFQIKGKGNIKSVEGVNLSVSEEFEAYQPVRKENLISAIEGEISIEQILIARKAGEFVIEPASFTFFNTDKGRYVTLKSPEYRVKVTGSSERQYYTSYPDNFSKESVRLIGKDISFIKADLGSVYLKEQIKNPFAYWLNYLLFIVLLPVVALLSRLYYNYKFADPVKLIRENAYRKAKKDLLRAAKKKEVAIVYDELSLIIYRYLAEKTGLSESGLILDEFFAEYLNDVDDDLKKSIKEIVQNAEISRYSPAASKGRDLGKDVSLVLAFLERINELL